MQSNATDFVVSLLDTRKHDRAAFSCGEPSLDTYLQRQASQDVKRRAAVVYVLTQPGEGRVVGYYTLSAASVRLTDLSEETQKKLARYPNVAASLIGRLAVDEGYKGQGWGAQLLRHALLRTLEQSRELAIAVVSVDALNDDARRFYERYGFMLMTSESSRLYIPVETVEKALKS